MAKAKKAHTTFVRELLWAADRAHRQHLLDAEKAGNLSSAEERELREWRAATADVKRAFAEVNTTKRGRAEPGPKPKPEQPAAACMRWVEDTVLKYPPEPGESDYPGRLLQYGRPPKSWKKKTVQNCLAILRQDRPDLRIPEVVPKTAPKHAPGRFNRLHKGTKPR
jgi:hypothetical protein